MNSVLEKLKSVYGRLKRLWELSVEYDTYRNKDMHRATEMAGKLNRRMSDLESWFRERTTVHADIHHHKPSHVIVVGEYRNRDYVRMFQLNKSNLSDIIEILKQMEPNAKVGRFDMVGGFNFSAVYEKERL